MIRKLGLTSVFLAAVLVAVAPGAVAQVNAASLAGSRNVRPEARPENDRGRVMDSISLQHMLLQLKRSPQKEEALQQFIRELQTEGSPNYHHWLTAQEFGARFGVDQSDLDAVTAWLQSQGFRVNVVYPNGMIIDLSGTAGNVRKAFQTEIHHLSVQGQMHIGDRTSVV